MRIAISQLNFQTGNIPYNTDKIIRAIHQASDQKAELILFPELSVCGAMSQDWLEREDFVMECRMAVEKIASHCNAIAAIVGAPNLDTQNGIMYNSAYFLQDGEVRDGVHKTILSDYDIFNESRYFIAGEDNTPIRYKNQNIRILFDEYEAEWIDTKDSFVIYMGMSPFTTTSLQERHQVFPALARKYGKNIFTVNHTGANTSIIFDGNSSVYNFKGELIHQLKDFEEDFLIADTHHLGNSPFQPMATPEKIALIHKALVYGLKDYFSKHSFQKAVLGLSGGIDSAVVAALAAEALGAENVMGLLMPSHFSTEHSIADARALAENIGMPYTILPIKEIYTQYLSTLQPLFQDLPFNVAEENIQARIRGMLVMAMSNKLGYVVLNTSNESEAAVGYGTLYGDLCGSLGVIGDVYKTDIFELARHINRHRIIIPENTITKAPSAELHPDQKDQDSLPPYAELDRILKLYIEENYAEKDLISKGFDSDMVNKTIRLVKQNEYKRAQCPPILRVSKKAFGIGRKYPY